MTTENLKQRGWERMEVGGMGGEGWTHANHPEAIYSRGAALLQATWDAEPHGIDHASTSA